MHISSHGAHGDITCDAGFRGCCLCPSTDLLKMGSSVNRRLSLEPGLPASWWPQPALASLRRHILFS